jgi:hypothetical protein
MNGRVDGLMRDADRLAWWLRAAARIASGGGALLLVAALWQAWTLAGAYQLGMFYGTIRATTAVTGLCLAFLLRRHAQKVQAAATSGQLGPLADGAAYETGYWRVATPVVALWTVMGALWFLSRVANAGTTLRQASWARAAADEAMPLETLVLYSGSVVFAGLAVLIATQAVTRRSQFAADVWRNRAARVRVWLDARGRAMREAGARRLEARPPVAVPRSTPRAPLAGDLPPALIRQWSQTRPLVGFVGCFGTLASLALAIVAVGLGLLFLSTAPMVLMAGVVFFIAMLALSSFRLLARQSAAIRAAETEGSISAAEDVLDRQGRYWKLVSIWTFIMLVLMLVLIGFGGEG